MAGDEIRFVASRRLRGSRTFENPTDALGRLDDDEKRCFYRGHSGRPSINVVNQLASTRLILRSNKPKAKQFQRWVIHAFCHQSIKLAGTTPSKTRLHQDWRPVTTMFLCACRGHQLLLPSRTISSP